MCTRRTAPGRWRRTCGQESAGVDRDQDPGPGPESVFDPQRTPPDVLHGEMRVGECIMYRMLEQAISDKTRGQAQSLLDAVVEAVRKVASWPHFRVKLKTGVVSIEKFGLSRQHAKRIFNANGFRNRRLLAWSVGDYSGRG